ncbi:hypothetical protein [Budvicia aquatica]|uniref:Uncharacterized protein n=1 Tax=Budvicia aquatica TaxID=82979 RepID=A0A484ZJZ3_9GAMM|nr:hypothetical protein [Budvicia aquatica]VFS48744.1 Uncharacterised protein [Budvicia aquatica]
MDDFKILFIGRSGSAKTTAINSASQVKVVSTDVLMSFMTTDVKKETTVGLDYGDLMVSIPGGRGGCGCTVCQGSLASPFHGRFFSRDVQV